MVVHNRFTEQIVSYFGKRPGYYVTDPKCYRPVEA